MDLLDIVTCRLENDRHSKQQRFLAQTPRQREAIHIGHEDIGDDQVGELGSYDEVRKASMIAMYAGADFIKTSTGKIGTGATLPVTLVMLEAIRDFHHLTGVEIGMKPAGGISNAKLALAYLVTLYETLGLRWMTPDRFRFGASSLLNDILMQLRKEQTGAYQSGDYFTLD